jgi:hypothetical protein
MKNRFSMPYKILQDLLTFLPESRILVNLEFTREEDITKHGFIHVSSYILCPNLVLF